MVQRLQGEAGDPRPGQAVRRPFQSSRIGLAHRPLPRGALGLLLGPRALDLLGAPLGLLQAADGVGLLAPIAQPRGRACFTRA